MKALVGKKVESRTIEYKVRNMGRWYTLAKKIGLIAIVLSDWFPQIIRKIPPGLDVTNVGFRGSQ